MRFDAISVIPEVFEPYVSASILGRARAAGLYTFNAHNLRQWTHDAHRTTDDVIYGGGPGMLMLAEPIKEAISATKEQKHAKVVFFAPWGKPFTQDEAQKLAQEEQVIFVCGRYEGIDERAYALADEVYSMGEYVVTGAELFALAAMDATVRCLPGALGDPSALAEESYTNNLIEYAQFTRPDTFNNIAVPEVLRSGDHEKIREWRRKSALVKTLTYKPHLLSKAHLSEKDYAFLKQYIYSQGKRLTKKRAEQINKAFPGSSEESAAPYVLCGSDAATAYGTVARAADDELQPSKAKRFAKTVAEFAIIIAIALGLAFVIRTFVAEPYMIPSGSMLETLQIGDKVLGEKVSLYFSDPKPGEIATFIDPEDANTTLIKRVIATPGQTIDLKDGNVYTDDVLQTEPYTNGKPTYPLPTHMPGKSISYPYTLKADEYWMMGDNRTDSKDSRYFGPIKRSVFTSHACAILWPLDQIKLL